jgi:hypothetical protein
MVNSAKRTLLARALMRTSILLLTFTLALPGHAAPKTDPCRVLTPELQGTYKGSCKNGLADGFGEATGKVTYKGNFVAGHAEGQGLVVYSNGGRYEGGFVADKKEGVGTWTSSKGEVLRGKFKQDLLDGVGELTTATGERRFVTENSDKKMVPYTAPTPVTSTETTATPEASAPTVSLPYGGELFPAFIIAMAKAKVRMTFSASDIGDPNGSLRFSVHTDESQAKLIIKVELDGVADPTVYEAILPTPGDYQIFPVIRYRYTTLSRLEQPSTVNLTWSVTLNGQETHGNAQPVRVRSVNDVPFSVRKDSGEWADTRFLFAAFVNEDHPWIDPLLQEALRTGKVRQFTGYQSHQEQEVLRQMDAVWTALQRRGLRYSDVTVNSDVSERVHSQHVRFLSDSITYAQANCVDGTVLLASIFQRIGLHSELALVPGHMYLGVASDADNKQWFFVESTMLGNVGLSAAIQKGREEAEFWGSPEQKDKLVAIRIQKARGAGVVPIAASLNSATR